MFTATSVPLNSSWEELSKECRCEQAPVYGEYVLTIEQILSTASMQASVGVGLGPNCVVLCAYSKGWGRLLL